MKEEIKVCSTINHAEALVFSARQLAAGHNGKVVVSGVDMNIHAGEIVCIIGPNGAGKSTLLHTITGHIPCISGQMTLCGRSFDRIMEKQRAEHMSVVLTDKVDAELMTCRDVVAAGRYPYTGRLGILRSKDRKLVEEALLMMNALDIGDKQISEVSDGQRQRIMIARAICQDTELLVLDEPTSYLDIRYRLEIMTILRKLAKEKGKAILMSVHEIELARAAADYVICIKDGSVFSQGRPEKVFTPDQINSLFDLKPMTYDQCLRSLVERNIF